MPPPVGLPLVICAESGSTVETLARRLDVGRSLLQRQVARVGAILFRGFGVRDARALSSLVASAGGEPMRYLGGDSPRTHVGGEVYTSTECPPAIRIPLHNELSYLSVYPRHLWFACVTPAARGGETTIADGRAIWRALDPSVRERFARSGVRYTYSFRGESFWWRALDRVRKVGKSWMEAFETDDWRVADAHCRQLASRHRWLPSGRVVLELDGPASLADPRTGEPAWFNQAHLFRFNPRYLGWRNYLLARILYARRDSLSHDAQFGDGSPLDGATLSHLYDVMEAHTVPVRWQAGDVLWLDNRVCLQGRNPFRGQRRVLVTLSR